MDVTPLIARDAQVIQSYSGGVFKISGQIYQGAVLVRAHETALWDIAGFDSLGVSDFEGFLDIDVILLGTGRSMKILPPFLRSGLRDAGIAVDSMDTGAACRTYNVLLAEGRRVMAALLPFS